MRHDSSTRTLRDPRPITRVVLGFAVVAAFATGLLSAAHVGAAAIGGRAARTYGARLAIGSGTARAYVTLAHGRPVEFGVALSETTRADTSGEAVDQETVFTRR